METIADMLRRMADELDKKKPDHDLVVRVLSKSLDELLGEKKKVGVANSGDVLEYTQRNGVRIKLEVRGNGFEIKPRFIGRGEKLLLSDFSPFMATIRGVAS